MKRLIIVMLVLCASLTAIVAQSNADGIPFKSEMSQLDKYLNLRSSQKSKVKSLNDNFIQKQMKCKAEGNLQGQEMQQIMTENLSGMKEVLSKGQYDKYVALIKITNKNYDVLSEDLLADLVGQVNSK